MYTDPTNGGQSRVPYPSASGYSQGYPVYTADNNYPVNGQPPSNVQNSINASQSAAGYPGRAAYQSVTGYQNANGYQNLSGYSGIQPPTSTPYQQVPGFNGQAFSQQGYYNNPAQFAGTFQQRQDIAANGNGYPGAINTSFIPQTPDFQGNISGGYPQTNGYARSNYPQSIPVQQMNGYSQGYPQRNGYSSNNVSQGSNMSAAQGTRGQMPINGGGYVPEKVPVRKKPFVFDDIKLLLLSAILLILAVAGLVTGMPLLKYVFLALTVISVAFFWLKPLIAENKRLCFSIVFGALALVTVVSLLTGGNSRGNVTTATTQVSVPSQSPTASAQAGANVVIDGKTGQIINNTGSSETPEPIAETSDTSATDRLESFFLYWSANKLDEMLTLCSPSWQSSVESAKTSLFGLMANRTPTDYSVEKITGTDEDLSRTVTVVSSMDRNNGKPVSKYRLTVIMVREGDEWYVDPNSLKTYETAETTEPVATTTPTAEPTVSSATILYYNPEGGTKYHLDQNCISTHAKYLPMKGHFTYGEVNDAKYAELSPCNVCAAPLR